MMRAIAWFVLLMLTGCGDAYKVAELNDLSLVDIRSIESLPVLTSQQLEQLEYQIIKPVRGSSVRRLLSDPMPARDDALLQAKYWAYATNANAITDVKFGTEGLSYATNTWAAIWCDALAIKVYAKNKQQNIPKGNLIATRFDYEPSPQFHTVSLRQ